MIGDNAIAAGEASDGISRLLADNSIYIHEALTAGGAHDGIITGSSGDDRLYGGVGNDRLTGGEGADTMAGGAGDDTYYADNGGDTVVEKPGGGIDNIIASVDFTLPANVENLTLTGSATSGKGNALANILTGDAVDNSLQGGSGNDTLYGMEGDDHLSGGAGSDTLYGGSGNDTLEGGDGGDRLVGGPGADSLYGGAGADWFVYNMLSDSPDASPDLIYDFHRSEGDRIDLSALSQGAYSFIGTDLFHASGIGQVNYSYSGNRTIVAVDAHGSGHADMEVFLVGHIAFTADDFVLR